MNQLQSSLQRSLTIDVSGLRAGCWPPPLHEPLPHCHSAPIVEAAHAGAAHAAAAAAAAAAGTIEEEHEIEQLQQQPGLEQVSPHCSPFTAVVDEVRSALGLRKGDGSEEGTAQGSCSEPVASATPRDSSESVFAASCSFPPAMGSMATLGSFMSHNYESSILLPGCIPFGVKAVCGKRAKMEDAFQALPFFFDLPAAGQDVHTENKLPARIASQLHGLAAAGLAPAQEREPEACTPQTLEQLLIHDADALHFFAVYDGHGGSEAATHCATRLHHHLSEALTQACQQPHGAAPLPAETYAGASDAACMPSGSDTRASAVTEVAETATAVLDEEAAAEARSSPKACQFSGQPGTETFQAGCDSQVSPQAVEEASLSEGASEEAASLQQNLDKISTLLQTALHNAFVRTDAEFAADGCASMVGSTAVVALIGKHKMWIANCGDSRAVLCRSGKVIQLTDDHKPEREDEAARVEKAGGQVLYWNGHRVMGVLAMSRAIGDHGLRPYVIPEPEITVLTRCDDDDFLLLASDGLWDVMANQEATNLAIRCMHRAWEKGASRKAAVRIAASVLTKAAIDRGSKDNVTVVIVDLKSSPPSRGAADNGEAGASKEHAASITEQTPLPGSQPSSSSPFSPSPFSPLTSSPSPFSASDNAPAKPDSEDASTSHVEAVALGARALEAAPTLEPAFQFLSTASPAHCASKPTLTTQSGPSSTEPPRPSLSPFGQQ